MQGVESAQVVLSVGGWEELVTLERKLRVFFGDYYFCCGTGCQD